MPGWQTLISTSTQTVYMTDRIEIGALLLSVVQTIIGNISVHNAGTRIIDLDRPTESNAAMDSSLCFNVNF